MGSAYAWEDSSKEALAMEAQSLYINKKSAITNYSFRDQVVWNNI